MIGFDTYNEAFSMTELPIPDLLPLYSRDYLREDELVDLIAQIKMNHTTFELSLKNNFAVLSHAMMDDILFPQTMSIFEIIHEHFGDILIIADNDSIYLPVSERPFSNIIIE